MKRTIKRTNTQKDRQGACLKRIGNGLLVGLPLLTIAAFFCTHIFLAGVFGEWNLSSMLLVTPTDAVVPGFMFGFLALAAIGFPLLMAGVIGRRSPRKVWGVVSRVGLSSALLGCAIWYFQLNEGVERLPAALLAAICGPRLAWDVMISKRLPSWAKVAAVVLAFPWAVWVVDAGTVMAGHVAKGGMVRGLPILAGPDTPCSGRVLWLGERAIVIRCSVGSEEIRVMSPKEGLKFSTERELALASKRAAQ